MENFFIVVPGVFIFSIQREAQNESIRIRETEKGGFWGR